MYLTFRLGFIQIRYLPLALRYVFGGKKDKDAQGEGDVSSFAALCTALSATIGTGNMLALQPLSN
ncbi:Na+/alanine symporter [Photobacterium damselae]|nr:Na+/alanine symporter [Photobacterium damselae]